MHRDCLVHTSLALPRPFDAKWLLGFMRTREASALECIGNDGLVRAVRINGRPIILRIRFERTRMRIESSCDVPASSLRTLARRMFDLDADLPAFYAAVASDRVLAPLVSSRPGLRVPQFADPFECVVRAVIGQQVSVRGASTLVSRFVDALSAGDDLKPFPLPGQVARSTPARLQSIGLTRARAASLHAIARFIADGRVDLERVRAMPADQAQATLDALPGIGPWTASYVRMRALGDRDAFPAADLGIIKAIRAATGNASLSVPDIERRAEAWRPWRAYAAIHLWSTLG
jgi:AraC family transcriptional regulator of adaptative response / DNA-3-methyladenine glycosylase II